MPATYLDDEWTIEGTTGTAYTVVAKTPRGVVGYRTLDDGQIRVRVEPEMEYTEEVHNALPKVWKKINEENDNHCSVVINKDSLYKALVQAFLALTGYKE